jgi:hypothetical protein
MQCKRGFGWIADRTKEIDQMQSTLYYRSMNQSKHASTRFDQIQSNNTPKKEEAISDQTIKERPEGRKSSGPTQSHRVRRSQRPRVAGPGRRYRTSNAHPRTFATTFFLFSQSLPLFLLRLLLLLLGLLWRRALAFSGSLRLSSSS